MPLPRGPYLLLVGVVTGVVAGERAGAGTAVPALAAGALLTGAVLVDAVARPGPVTARRARARLVVGVLAVALLGAAAMQRASHGLEHSPLTGAVAGYRSATAWVTLTEDPSGSTRFVVDGLGRVSGRTVLVVASGDAAGRLRILSAGDRALLRGSFRPLSGWESRYRWRHAVGAFSATELLDARRPESPLVRLANGLRALVLRGTDLAPARERALLAGLLLGDTRGVAPETVEQFRESGLTHHLAVSGENVAFVLALVSPIVGRLGHRGRFAAGLAVLLVFGTMTRWEPSVLRAVAMAATVMLAGVLGRPAAGARVLALAVSALLLADPFLVHSVGFLLSCGATLGIVLLAVPFAHRLPGPRLLREPFAVTLAAQVGVAPVLLPVFGSVPLASLPANVAAAPLMAPITIGGLVAGTLGGVLRGPAPMVAVLLLAPVVALVQALEGIAAAGARVPVDVTGSGALGLVALASAGCATALLLRSATGRVRAVEPPSTPAPAAAPTGLAGPRP